MWWQALTSRQTCSEPYHGDVYCPHSGGPITEVWLCLADVQQIIERRPFLVLKRCSLLHAKCELSVIYKQGLRSKDPEITACTLGCWGLLDACTITQDLGPLCQMKGQIFPSAWVCCTVRDTYWLAIDGGLDGVCTTVCLVSAAISDCVCERKFHVPVSCVRLVAVIQPSYCVVEVQTLKLISRIAGVCNSSPRQPSTWSCAAAAA